MKHAVQKFSGQYKLAKTKQKILLPRNAIVTRSLCVTRFSKNLYREIVPQLWMGPIGPRSKGAYGGLGEMDFEFTT